MPIFAVHLVRAKGDVPIPARGPAKPSQQFPCASSKDAADAFAGIFSAACRHKVVMDPAIVVTYRGTTTFR